MAWGDEIPDSYQRKFAVDALHTEFKALYEARGYTTDDFVNLENKIKTGMIDAEGFQHEQREIIGGMRIVAKYLQQEGKDSIERSLIESIVSDYKKT